MVPMSVALYITFGQFCPGNGAVVEVINLILHVLPRPGGFGTVTTPPALFNGTPGVNQ
jgi:hypothetical protein